MKSLSLYIDKNYIAGVVNTDTAEKDVMGKVYPIPLVNGEDRIWLYFYEDKENSSIVYGKAYEKEFRDRNPRVHGDVFSLIEKGEAFFNRFNNADRHEPIHTIFGVSGIFDTLHAVAKKQPELEVYISFSPDISDVSRHTFIKELEKNKFVVKCFIPSMAHLALEECGRRGKCTEEGHYLVLTACNENLHYALYEYRDGLYLRAANKYLPGYGFDPRCRALMEYVVEKANNASKLLQTTQQIEDEYLRQEQFVDDWLKRLEKAKKGIPVSVEVNFALATENKQQVAIKSKEIEDRTESVVREIVQKVTDFSEDAGVKSYQIKGIVLIGDVFTNARFRDKLSNQFSITPDSLHVYMEKELGQILNVYHTIDLTQFEEAGKTFQKNADSEAKRRKEAVAEAKRKAKAEKEIQDRERKLQEAGRAEREYGLAMDKVAQYEKERDYEQMEEWAQIALTHRSEDDTAKEKLESARQLKHEKRANIKQYNAMMHRVKAAEDEGRWQDAISLCDTALSLQPDSVEAQRVIKEARKQLDVKEKVTNYLNRIDLFLAQKLYEEALEEINKVLSLEPDNQSVLDRQKEVSAIREKQKAKIEKIVETFDQAIKKKDYAHALDTCEKLISLDAPNRQQWEATFAGIKHEIKQIEEERLSRQRDFESAITNIQTLLSQKKVKEADVLLKQLSPCSPQEEGRVKELRKRIFDCESRKVLPSSLPKNTKPDTKGNDFFDNCNKESCSSAKNTESGTKGNDFFDSNNATKKSGRKAPNKASGADFFDTASSAPQKTKKNQPVPKTDEFDF